MTNDKFKMTKQGVRDLDDAYGKIAPSKKVELPVKQYCLHKNARSLVLSGETYCPDCETRWDCYGQEY